MGTLKQLLPWGKTTIIESAIDAACNCKNVDQVIVVLGHEANKIRATLEKKIRPKLEIVVNPDYKLGMFSSVKAGVRALAPKVKAFLIAPGDQPEIRSEEYDKISTIFKNLNESQDIIIPVYKHKGGHPTLFKTSLCSEILNMPYGGNGLRDLIHKYNEKILRINMEYAGIIHDLDTKTDYLAAINRRNDKDGI
ncbi:MAG: nucleotidyltransferase family protein [Clostridium sp.]|nr:nucleotidyltransferase family protein [Clostridium sp.]